MAMEGHEVRVTRELLEQVVQVVRAAGAEVMKVYATDFQALNKADASPVTLADGRADVVEGRLSIPGRWWKYRASHRMFGMKFWAFVVGAAPLPAELYTPHEVTLPEYWIGTHEVTWAQYAAFCAACATQPERVFAIQVEYGIQSPERRAELVEQLEIRHRRRCRLGRGERLLPP